MSSWKIKESALIMQETLLFIFAKKTPPEMFGKVINTSLRNNII